MPLYGQSFSFDGCLSNPTIATVHSVHSNLDTVLTGIAKGLDRLFCRCFPGRIQAETYTDHSWKYNRAPSVRSEHLPLLQVQMMNPRLQVQFLPKRDLRFQQKLPCITLTKRCVYFLRELWKANELTLKIP